MAGTCGGTLPEDAGGDAPAIDAAVLVDGMAMIDVAMPTDCWAA